MYSDAPEKTAEEGNDYENGCVRIINSRYQKLHHIYNPNSVVEALMRGPLVSYWKNTGSFGSLRKFITLNYAGLKEDVVYLLSGGRRKVNINNFQNDLIQFKKKDDVLACLTSIINFHDENALAVAIMISYYTARADYRVIRELPAGRGFAKSVGTVLFDFF